MTPPATLRRINRWLRFCLLALLLTGMLLVALVPEVRSLLMPGNLSLRLAALGPWAYVAFLPLFVLATMVAVPPTLLIAAASALLGHAGGFLFGLVAVNLSGYVEFWIARGLGREAVRGLLERRFRRLEKAMETRGFSVVLYLRAMAVPFWIVSYAAGLSNIRLKPYLGGTLAGTLPGIFITSFVGDRVGLILARRSLDVLWDPMSLAAGLILAATLLLPLALKRKAPGITAALTDKSED